MSSLRFAGIVSSTRAATIENVTRRAARAAGERRDDSGDESDASAAPDIDSDDDEVPYNPKNLPLGWDGKVTNTITILCHTSTVSRKLNAVRSLLLY